MPDTEATRKQKDAEYGNPAISLRAVGLVWQGLLSAHWKQYAPPIPAHIVALMLAGMKDIRIAYPDIGDEALADARFDNGVYHDIEKGTRV